MVSAPSRSSPDPEPEHQGHAEQVDGDRCRPQQREPHAASHLRGEPLAVHPGEAVHHVRHRAVGPDVLGSAELLAQEAEERGALGSHRPPPGDGDRLEPDHPAMAREANTVIARPMAQCSRHIRATIDSHQHGCPHLDHERRRRSWTAWSRRRRCARSARPGSWSCGTTCRGRAGARRGATRISLVAVQPICCGEVGGGDVERLMADGEDHESHGEVQQLTEGGPWLGPVDERRISCGLITWKAIPAKSSTTSTTTRARRGRRYLLRRRQ